MENNNFTFYFVDGSKETVTAFNLKDATILAMANRIMAHKDKDLKYVLDGNRVVRKNRFECKHDSAVETVEIYKHQLVAIHETLQTVAMIHDSQSCQTSFDNQVLASQRSVALILNQTPMNVLKSA